MFPNRQQVPEKNQKKKKTKWRGDRATGSHKLHCVILWLSLPVFFGGFSHSNVNLKKQLYNLTATWLFKETVPAQKNSKGKILGILEIQPHDYLANDAEWFYLFKKEKKRKTCYSKAGAKQNPSFVTVGHLNSHYFKITGVTKKMFYVQAFLRGPYF